MKAIHTGLKEMRVACTSSRVRSVHCPELQCIMLLCPQASDRLTRRVYAGAPGPLLAMCTHIGLLLKNHMLPAEMYRFKRRITEKTSEKTTCLNSAN